MDKRFTLFMVAAVAVMLANQVIWVWFFAPEPQVKPANLAKVEGKKEAASKDAVKKEVAAEPAPNKAPAAAPAPAAQADNKAQPAEVPKAVAAPGAAADPPVEPKWVALGSADPNSPYRMLVYLTNRGAAIERLEMNSPRYRDLENFSGYLGYLAPTNATAAPGALVRIVGPGTPAAKAGLQPGDVITAIGNTKIANAAGLIAVLARTEEGQAIELSIARGAENKTLTARLGRRPLEVMRAEHESKPVELVRPGNHDPLSFLMSLQQVGDDIAAADGDELGGAAMKSRAWEVEVANETLVRFRRALPERKLLVTKTYRLEKVPPDQSDNTDYPAYSLQLEVSIANTGDAPQKVAYRLDGPTGLPIEGYWYAIKVSRTWGGAGLRDVISRFQGGSTTQVSCSTIAADDFDLTWSNSPLDFIAVDAQYFAAALIPQKRDPNEVWFSQVRPIRVGAVPEDKKRTNLTNVSFALTSEPAELAPGGEPLTHSFQIFAGPKKPHLLEHYATPGTNITLTELVYYGWFGFVAKPMLFLLHSFHALVGNYGLAIIMLTVLVRSCMFPLSRKQALSAQKMQLLQPEMKRINEKFKNEPEKKMKAQQQLYREHNFNPLGGCLLAFVQLPIFVGLYRSLSVDVELRQAPLFTEAIRWASNLAAPDMLWDWTNIMPQFITHGTGFFALGPYLNILPLVTVALFIWQQKMFMPPPADEQAALQQKMMQYMMIFMGILFYKVASGLCVYFVASSLWGIAERKLLPKVASQGGPTASGAASGPAAQAATSGNGAALRKKRQKGRR